jgi:uncharacterized protein YjbI with pentapeptide repeats
MVAEEFCATRGSGGLMIVGGDGAGKTTALAHLAAVLPNADDIVLLDQPELAVAVEAARHALVLFTSCDAPAAPDLHRVQLAPWSRDDLIEYLLAVHPTQCRSVMSRLSLPAGLRESPLFWKSVLDALAANEQLGDLEQAIEACLEQCLRDPELQEAARWYCLGKVLQLQDEPCVERQLQHALARESLLFIKAGRVTQSVAREQAPNGLLSARSPELLAAHWPLDLVDKVALQLTPESDATNVLRQSLNSEEPQLYATAASLLVRIDPLWQPHKNLHRQGLDGAYLQHVNWQKCDLSKFVLKDANLTGADLRHTNLTEATVKQAVLFHCELSGARLSNAALIESSLEETDLSDAKCQKATFHGVCLQDATAQRANFDAAQFMNSDCQQADFRQARFRKALFDKVDLSAADFSEADLSGATLNDADLRTAKLSGACLQKAKLQRVNIEDVEWVAIDATGADLEGAMCTGSTLRSAILREAVLKGAELGEIHWEEADLRDADLRGATFHMGSSRSGLIFTPIACEGSRTGFYTDESLEQHFQSPEEIRKANLRSADLRGANVEGVDFYLVDLRGALLDPEQLEQARRTRAILDRD